MNQILVTEKLYITPELKKKKKMYKFDFFISVFLVCILFSYYIYAEYDKTKNESESKSILSSIKYEEVAKVDDTTIKFEDSSAIIVILNASKEYSAEEIEIATEDILPTVTETEVPQINTEPEINDSILNNIEVTDSGIEYYRLGVIRIPSIDVEYAIIAQTDGKVSDELLKKSPMKFHGCNPNEVGNLCIVGHNYRNKRFFSKVPTLENGDIIEITDLTNTTVKYEVYDKYIVDPDDENANDGTTQKTDGRREITLITCTNDSQNRWMVKAKEVI